jgi:hypothetical protein
MAIVTVTVMTTTIVVAGILFVIIKFAIIVPAAMLAPEVMGIVRQRTAVHIINADLAPLQGPTHKGNPIFGLSFSQNIADVIINRAFTNLQLFGNVLVGEASGN